jgi:uncharacterized membrane protein YeaQ/YmgE (transglycosylase-associated protein family)
MINFLLWLVGGGVIGWVASIVMLTGGQQDIFLNVIVGIVGAALAGWFLSPLVGLATINLSVFSVDALLVSLVGAIILVAVVSVFRPGPVH